MTLLALLALLLGGVALSSLLYAVVLPRVRADARLQDLEIYGYETAKPAAVPSDETRSSTRLAERIGDLLGRRFGTDGDSALRQEILAAGLYKLTPRQLIGYQVLAAASGAAFGLLTDGLPGLGGPVVDTALFAGIGWLVPITYVRRTGRLRMLQIDRGLPDVIDLLVVSVEAGSGFGAALATAADRAKGPLGDELRLTLQEQRFGLAMTDALDNLNKRADTPNMRTFVRSVVQGEKLGVSIGQIMRGVATEMRLRRRQVAEERAQKTTVKILFPLVFLILPPLAIVVLAPAIYSLADSIGG